MHYVVRRMGFRLTRGWASLLLVAAALLATAFWVGPLRPEPPELQLVALGSDGQFRNEVGLATSTPAANADSAASAPGDSARAAPPRRDDRFPLILAVHNSGTRAGTPRRLSLSVPVRIQLTNSKGQVYPPRLTTANPLGRYVFNVDLGRIEPGGMPRVIPTLDTLWLSPNLPGYYCTMGPDSIPDFVPAAQYDPEMLSRIEIFYSLATNGAPRQTGLLHVQLDPAALRRSPAPMPPRLPLTLHETEAPRPAAGPLKLIGTRTTACGDPGAPMELYNALWETPTGGRYFVLYSGTQPRKFLFDLDRDSIIELEIWDGDGDGKYEASRPARLPIPEFLIPRPLVVEEPVKVDSLGADSVRVDSGGAATAVLPGAGTPVVPPLDTALVRRALTRRLFYESDAGPFRFHSALERARTQPAGADSAPPRPQGPRLLGTPVPRADSARIERERRARRAAFVRDSIRLDSIRQDSIRRDTIRT